jgi:hypothetical protein
MSWRPRLRADPLGWLLATDTPAVRAATLQRLADRPADAQGPGRPGGGDDGGPDPVDPGRPAARRLVGQARPRLWAKYRGTVWQVIFLDQLGADPGHPRVARACEYVLGWCPTACGGFGCSAARPGGPLVRLGHQRARLCLCG